MKKTIQKIIIISLLAVVTILSAVKPATAQGYGLSDPAELETFLDSYLAEQMESHHILGVVITFVKEGEVFFSKGYGYANIEKQIPFNPEATLLTTASLGKAFTAVGGLPLNALGGMDLYEDVEGLPYTP